jgi:hypothetical protein
MVHTFYWSRMRVDSIICLADDDLDRRDTSAGNIFHHVVDLDGRGFTHGNVYTQRRTAAGLFHAAACFGKKLRCKFTTIAYLDEVETGLSECLDILLPGGQCVATLFLIMYPPVHILQAVMRVD